MTNTRRKQDDPLSDKDRAFLHLLVGPEEFGIAVTHDTASYLRESRCYYECIRLIEKFCGQDVDTSLMERNIDPRPKKRFCDIVIFISHFFGRAELCGNEKRYEHSGILLCLLMSLCMDWRNRALLSKKKRKQKRAQKAQKQENEVWMEVKGRSSKKMARVLCDTTNDKR